MCVCVCVRYVEVSGGATLQWLALSPGFPSRTALVSESYFGRHPVARPTHWSAARLERTSERASERASSERAISEEIDATPKKGHTVAYCRSLPATCDYYGHSEQNLFPLFVRSAALPHTHFFR